MEENDGITDEQYQGPDKADIVWSFDMIEELGVFPHNLATSSPIVLDNLVLLVSGNGVDEGHLNIPMPIAPSFDGLITAFNIPIHPGSSCPIMRFSWTMSAASSLPKRFAFALSLSLAAFEMWLVL